MLDKIQQSLKAVESELAQINKQLYPLERRRDELIIKRLRLQSLNVIVANQIRHEDVELSSGDGKPLFKTVWEFSEWMKEHDVRKRFCEWNGTIYFTDEILAGKLDASASARIEDLSVANWSNHT